MGCVSVVRVFYVLRKKAGMEDAHFRDYWRNTQGPLMARIPGLLKYIQSYPFPDPHGDPLPADGIAELQFASIPDMLDALASSEAKAALADVANFADTASSGAIVIEEDQVLV